MFEFIILTHMQNTNRRLVKQFTYFIELNENVGGWHSNKGRGNKLLEWKVVLHGEKEGDEGFL